MVSGEIKTRGATVRPDLATGPAKATKQDRLKKLHGHRKTMGYSTGLYPSQWWENEDSEVPTTLFLSTNLNISFAVILKRQWFQKCFTKSFWVIFTM